MLKKISCLVTGLCCLSGLLAQNPVNWTFTAKKIADKTYELSLTATVPEPWHIYSQATPAGGPLPTRISFNKNALVELQGEIKETGKLIQQHEEVFDLDVKFFRGKVSFVQTVKLKANVKTNLGGTVEFMVCTDQQCLPPKQLPFNIALQ